MAGLLVNVMVRNAYIVAGLQTMEYESLSIDV